MKKLFSFCVLVLGLALSSGCGSTNLGCIVASYQSSTTGFEVGIGSNTLGGSAIAQSFTVTEQKTALNVTAKLMKVGTITSGHSLTMTLEAGTTSPSGVALTTQTLLTDSITSTSGADYLFTFPSGVSLAPGTYWIQLTASYALSDTNLIKWVAHDGSPGDYQQGVAKYFTGLAWDTALIGTLRDLVFNVGC